ncbi:MAG: DUF5067 domain-containing protein [Lachnospira sp.]|nr:DUF5067 domain-containing protein [Lachnospira sp.]
MTNGTKKCKYCQAEMPLNSNMCLQCGKRQGGALKYILIAVAVFIVIGVVVAGFGKDDGPKKVNTNNSVEDDTKNDATTEENKKDTFTVGETAEMQDIQVTLSNYEESEGSSFYKPSEGKVFVLAEFEIANNSDKDLAISSLLSFKAYADDYSLNYSVAAMIDKSDSTLDGSVAAGKKMKGWIGYEVNADWGKVEIEFSPEVWKSKKFKFLIEK